MLAKMKQWLGIGGVKVELRVNPQVPKASQVVNGAVFLTAKSDQKVLSVEVKLKEFYTTGRGESKHTKEFELGKTTIPTPFEMKAGESKSVEFELPFQILKSTNDQLQDHGGVFGAIGKLGAMADNERSEYKLYAMADVQGTALDPNDIVNVKLI